MTSGRALILGAAARLVVVALAAAFDPVVSLPLMAAIVVASSVTLALAARAS